MGKELAHCGIYAAKLFGFSFAAAVPVFFLREPVLTFFGDASSRLVAFGVPLAVESLIFALGGVGLLVAFKDPVAASFVGAFSGKKKGQADSGKDE